MFAHVCGKYCINDKLSHAFEVVSLEFVHPVVLLVSIHEGERCSNVMVLKHTNVVVPHRNRVLDVRQEDVVHSGVLVIVDTRCNEERYHFHVVKAGDFFQVSLDHEVV